MLSHSQVRFFCVLLVSFLALHPDVVRAESGEAGDSVHHKDHKVVKSVESAASLG